MTDLSFYFLVLVGKMTLSNVVVMAEVYYFDSNGDFTSEYCSNHEIAIVAASSKLECGLKCGSNVLCHGIVYEPETKICKEIHINNFPDRRCQTGGGHEYFARKVPSCYKHLVTGPDGVADSQLSESTYYCDEQGQITYSAGGYCLPTEVKYYSAWYARLGSVGVKTGSWTPYYLNADQYVQVDFQQPRIVSAVILTGRDIFEQYVTSFKFLYSDDCTLFKELKYENGSVVILQGNIDGSGIVTRHLPERIQARCVRINPLTYFSHLSMRFDLQGCP